MRERTTEILIVGGGLGGVAGALAAARLGRRVILTEETDWIGGQLTAQAVPPDEHPWIETTGCTASYRRFREGVRDYYRKHYPLTTEARHDRLLNPGQGFVSPLCHEPRVALAVLREMLAPYEASHLVEILLRHRPVSADTGDDRVRAVTLRDEDSGDDIVIEASYVLDATELGDLLELADVEHVTGAESRDETGELHALDGPANPLDQQAISWCFAVDYLPDEDHTIDKPADYDFWRGYKADFWPAPMLGWTYTDPFTMQPIERPIFDGPPERMHATDFWHYRRILWAGHLVPGSIPSDISLVNWPQIDYWLGPLAGVSDEDKAAHIRAAGQLSLSFLYWMQTEAPRHDGGTGYKGLRLRPDVVGTTHGLAKQVYVRESRRIRAAFTVLEEHVGVEQREGLTGAEEFADSVGTGSYRIDLHPGTGLRNYIDVSNYPFQIPLGALLPVRMENLLPANKNLGVTHITNGCYRLHPVEWNIGEAAGALAAWCLDRELAPRQVHNTPERLREFQGLLKNRLGFVLEWPDYARFQAR